jgi:hypothetical protein
MMIITFWFEVDNLIHINKFKIIIKKGYAKLENIQNNQSIENA